MSRRFRISIRARPECMCFYNFTIQLMKRTQKFEFTLRFCPFGTDVFPKNASTTLFLSINAGLCSSLLCGPFLLLDLITSAPCTRSRQPFTATVAKPLTTPTRHYLAPVNPLDQSRTPRTIDPMKLIHQFFYSWIFSACSVVVCSSAVYACADVSFLAVAGALRFPVSVDMSWADESAAVSCVAVDGVIDRGFEDHVFDGFGRSVWEDAVVLHNLEGDHAAAASECGFCFEHL